MLLYFFTVNTSLLNVINGASVHECCSQSFRAFFISSDEVFVGDKLLSQGSAKLRARGNSVNSRCIASLQPFVIHFCHSRELCSMAVLPASLPFCFSSACSYHTFASQTTDRQACRSFHFYSNLEYLKVWLTMSPCQLQKPTRTNAIVF